jgi:hypothetical protein
MNCSLRSSPDGFTFPIWGRQEDIDRPWSVSAEVSRPGRETASMKEVKRAVLAPDVLSGSCPERGVGGCTLGVTTLAVLLHRLWRNGTAFLWSIASAAV